MAFIYYKTWLNFLNVDDSLILHVGSCLCNVQELPTGWLTWNHIVKDHVMMPTNPTKDNHILLFSVWPGVRQSLSVKSRDDHLLLWCDVGRLAVRNLIWSLGKETLHSRNTLHAHCCRGFHCIFQLVHYVRVAEVSAGHTYAGKITTSYMNVLVINWLAIILTLLRRKMR